jgi:hypothetical protein
MVPYQKKEIKMKYLIKVLFLVTIIGNAHQQYALDTIVTFYLQKYPYFKAKKNDHELLDNQSLEKLSKKVQQPGFLSGKIIKKSKRSSGVPGIMCMYGGHVALSDQKGQVILPRLQETPSMNFLITKGIKAAYILAPATVHNWQVDPAQPSKMYNVKLKQNEETQLYYFEATLTKPNKDNSIPLNTVIIISDPENIFIPLGATITNYSPNLTLPNIYIKKEFCFVYNAFYTLAIKQYFKQTYADYQQEALTVSTIQQPNK